MQWDFEPGHSAAEFRCWHMMVTWVRGHFKNIRGFLNFNPEDPSRASVRAEIDAKAIWTGEPQRDEHLRSVNFLDAEHHPKITFMSTGVEVLSQHEYRVKGDLTMRGVTRKVVLDSSILASGRRLTGRRVSIKVR